MSQHALALTLALALLAAGCKSSGSSSAPEEPADTAAGEPVAPGAPGAAQAGGELAQDAERLDLAGQKRVFLVNQHLDNAQALAAELRLDEALAEVDAALALDPDSPRARDLRIEVLALRGDPVGSAQTVAQEMAQQWQLRVQQIRGEAEDAVRKAKVLIARSEYTGAIGELEIANNLIRYAPYSIEWNGLDVEAANLLELARTQREAAEEQKLLAEQRKATEELRREEERARGRTAALVATALDEAMAAFRAGEFDEAEELAKRALEKDPRNSQAKEVRDAAFRAGRTKVRQEYLREKNEQFRRWQESMDELLIPYTDVITEPDAEFWREITAKRAKRRGIDLSQKMTPGEVALQNDLRTRLVQIQGVEEEESISAVMDQLATVSGLPIVTDPAADNAVRDAGVIFTFSFDNRVTAEQALNLITRMTADSVTWTIRHDVVLVTTKEKARGKPVPVNHDVQDLIFGLTDFTGPRIDRVRLIDELQDDDGGGPFGGIGEKPKLIEPSDLATLIQENVAVGTWTDDGVSIDAGQGYILVTHTPEVQAQVRAFLDDLRRFQSSLVTIESKFMTVASNWIQEIGVDFRGLDDQVLNDVTNGLEDMASRGLDNGGTGTAGQNAAGHPSAGVFYDDGQDGNFLGTTQNFFGAALGDAISTIGGLSFQLTFLNDIELSAILRAVEKSSEFQLINDQVLSVHNTQRAYVAVVNQRAYIQDFDVEVAQFQAVADPQVNVLNEGVVLDVRPTIQSDRKYLILEIQPTVARVVALRNFSSTLGGNTSPVDFQLPEVEVQSVYTTATIPDGGSILLGGLSSVRNIERRAEVPWFAKIPLVGFFFKQEGYNDENRSLMILIRARITDVHEEIERLEAR